MNLEYAAYLLNESHILSEDANSSFISIGKTSSDASILGQNTRINALA